MALSILPLMLTTSALLRVLRPWLGGDDRPRVQDGLAGLLRIVLTDRGGTAASAAARLLDGNSGGLLTVGTIGSLFTVTRAFRSILASLDAMMGYPTRPPLRRQWAWATTLAALAVVLTAVTLAMTALGPLLGHSRDIGDGFGRVVGDAWPVVRYPVALVILVGFVLLVFRVGLSHLGPGRTRLRWRDLAPGAAATSVSWLIITAMLPIYVHAAGAANSAIGALGGGLILLVWAYLLMIALFVGAAVVVHRRPSRQGVRPA